MVKSFLSIYLFSVINIFTQSFDYSNLTFEHLSIEDGLSQITVHAILNDSRGFLWFGTEDGLNRYNGYEFTVFRHDPSEKNSISDNFIWTIIEDHDSNIWIGTNSGGLNKYNYENNSFTSFQGESGEDYKNVRILLDASDGRILVGTENSGLFYFNKIEKDFEKIKFPDRENLSIRALCKDETGIIWIGTHQNGLYTLDQNSKLTHIFDEFPGGIGQLPIWALKTDEKNNIWIGTYNYGLFKYDRLANVIMNYNKLNNSEISNNNITSILIDDRNNPWICTEGGLSLLDLQKGIIHNYDHNVSDLRSLSSSLLRFISSGNSNIIWIGTVGGGINKINLNKKFTQFNHNPTDEKSLSHNMIRAIEEDSFGNIWIGTLGNGMNRYDKIENRFYRYNKENSVLNANVVTSILEGEPRVLWVGTWGGGLEKIRFTKNYNVIEKTVYKTNALGQGNSISSNIVQTLFKDSQNNLWIGTEEGLDRMDLESGIIENFRHDPQNPKSISDNRVQSKCIIEDRFGYLWIGTWNGLNRIHTTEGKNSSIEFERYFKKNGLSENRIISLYEDQQINIDDTQVLWIGTIGGGINKMTIYHKDKQSLKYEIQNFTERDGLPSNVIYGILGDKEGNLWLSTNNGLSKFYTKENKIRNFDIDDGLQSNQFFWGAYHRTDDYEFYFGGINGLNSFYPDQLVENRNIPPLYITKCVFESKDGSYELEINNIERIRNNELIELPYDTYDIQIYYSALDFTTPSKNKYKYFLENYDDEWSEESYSNYTIYKNIDDGKYIFMVKGSNNDGVWSSDDVSINFTIVTPFWKTWWFMILIFLIIAGMIVYIIASQIKNVLAVERLRTKLAADLHDNIGSSLTEISILSEVISTRIKSEDSEIVRSLEKISNKSRKLIDKMSDIVWLVNPQRDSLYDLILRLQDTYSDLLSDTEISFRSENLKSLEKVSLSMEHRQHLFLIFKEAINNSITHSKCSEIILNAHVHGKTLTMILKDNGVGFDPSEKKHGNGLLNMRNRANKIGGNLVIESENTSGTVIKYFGYIK